jgi:uncharacterized protein YbaR (Trm112 family)
MDPRMLELLVCPVCKGPLEYLRPPMQQQEELLCAADRLAFPVKDGIPVMLESQARVVEEDRPAAPHEAVALAATATTGLPPNGDRP